MDIPEIKKLQELGKINELVSSNEFEEAKVALQSLLQAEPNDIEALKLLGLCNVNLGKFQEGKNNFETVFLNCFQCNKFRNADLQLQ